MLADLARCRREQAEAAEMYRRTGSFNAALWAQDWTAEECLILGGMRLSPIAFEQKLKNAQPSDIATYRGLRGDEKFTVTKVEWPFVWGKGPVHYSHIVALQRGEERWERK